MINRNDNLVNNLERALDEYNNLKGKLRDKAVEIALIKEKLYGNTRPKNIEKLDWITK